MTQNLSLPKKRKIIPPFINRYLEIRKKTQGLENDDVLWLENNQFHFALNENNINYEKISDASKRWIIKCRFNAVEMEKHMNELIRLFGENNIPVILIKGIKDVFAGEKKYIAAADIDILLKKKDIERAESILVKERYQESENWKEIHEIEKWHFHHSYMTESHKYPVELHWRLIDRIFPFKFDEKIIWRDRIRPFSKNVYILNPEFECIYLIASTFRDAGGGFLKNWSRIERLIEGKFDWKKFNNYITYHNLYDFCLFFFKESYSLGLTDEKLFNKLAIKRGSLYRKSIFKVFFPRGLSDIWDKDSRHLLFLLLLYPNPRHIWYYLMKGAWMFKKFNKKG